MDQQTDMITPQEVVTFLKEKLKDQMSTLEWYSLRESDTLVTIHDRAMSVLETLWQGMKEVLPEPPKIEVVPIDGTKAKIQAIPKNETAKRLIQMINCQMPQL